MAYDDRYYYGQARIVVQASSGEVTLTGNGKTITKTIEDGRCSFLVTGTKEYTITYNGKSKTVYASFGDCILIKM